MTNEDYKLIIRALIASRPREEQYSILSLTYPSDLGMWKLVRNTVSEALAQADPDFDIAAFNAKTEA